MVKLLLILLIILLVGEVQAEEDLWQITFYCACPKCCGKWADGITASGYKADDGVVACNILPMWTIIHIEGFGYRIIMDRGSKRYFDGKKHIDIYVNDHEKAKQLGVMWRKVKVIKKVSER